MNAGSTILTLALLGSALTVSAGPSLKPEASGAFVDRDGGRHPWRISDTHTLYFDGRPYLPVGGMFNSSYIFWEQHHNPPGRDPEAEFRRTCLRLDLIRDAGLEDLYLHFCTLRVPPKVIQRVVDALEERGFKYGLEITSVPEEPCPGYLLRPEQFRVPAAEGKARLLLDTETLKLIGPNAVGVRWVALGDERPVASGLTELSRGDDETVTSDVLVPPEATEVVFSPCVHMDPGDPAAMFSGYEEYEQRLRQWLAAIEFGPGFRFIVDPFRNEQDMSYDTLPDHPEFIGGLSARLSELYPSVEELTRSWATSPALPDFATAAAAIPVTSGCLVDAAGHMYRLGKGTRYFGDVGAYRDDRAEEFNCRIADAVKSVHDVPVIFKHNVAFKGMFTNSRDKGGFDGLGWESYGDAASLVVHNAGVCFAEAEQSAHTMWSVVTETSPAAFETQKEEIGYLSPERMFDAFDTFLRAGAKGLFVFGFTFDPPGGFMTTEVIRDPRNLQWMAAYKRVLEASAERVAAYKPNYAYCYPARQGFAAVVGGEDFAIDGHTGGGKVFPLPGGSWVLPAESRDVETPLLIGTRDRAEMVRAALGVRQEALKWPTLQEFRQQVLGCRFLPKEHGRIRLYSEDLKLMASWPDMPLPERSTGGNAAIEYGYYYDTFGYETAWAPVDSVAELSVARPEGWIEGEDAVHSTFNLPREDGYEAFSGGLAMSVYCTDTEAGPFRASYRISVPEPGTYELWVRERTLAAMSPSRFCVDDGPWRDVPPDLQPENSVRLDWWSSIFAGNELAWTCYGQFEAQTTQVQIAIEALADKGKRTEKHIDALRVQRARSG